jgi:threonine dehydrogenase-like Zn-dependent dehydrogenase
MKATVFVEPGRIELREKPVPEVGPLDALLRVTTTTICGTDVHIMKGEYPVAEGLTIGHEAVGVIERLGSAVRGYREGQRAIAGAITPSGWSNACLCGRCSQDGAGTKHGWRPMGGWRFGNTIDGCQAEYVLVPDAMANLAPVPDELTDEQVLMCPDIMSTGFSGAESGKVQIGDAVAVFAQAPIGLCATAGAKLMGATTIIAVDRVPERLAIARRLGADHVVDFSKTDPVQEIMRLTDGRGVDVAIEALGAQSTFEGALRVLRPGGTLSSLGVYSTDLTIPRDAFAAGLGDHTIVTTLCPGGKERMRRLMDVIANGRLDLKPLVTHRFPLDRIVEAYDLFSHQRDGVMKVAITPECGTGPVGPCQGCRSGAPGSARPGAPAWRTASARTAAMAWPRRTIPANGTGSPASARARVTHVLHVKCSE